MASSETIAFEAKLASIKTLDEGDEISIQIKLPRVYREKGKELLDYIGCYGTWAVGNFVDATKPAK